MLTGSILITILLALLLNAWRRYELKCGCEMECALAKAVALEFLCRPDRAGELFNDLRDLELRNPVTQRIQKHLVLLHAPRFVVFVSSIMGIGLAFAGTYVLVLARATVLWAILSLLIDNFFPWTAMLMPLIYVSSVMLLVQMAINLMRTRRQLYDYAGDIVVLCQRYTPS